MQEALLTWDRKTLIYLNNLGTESFDTFWSILTYTPIWIPLFIFFIFLFKKKHSRQEAAIKISTVLLMVVFIILVTHWTKVSIERIRPNNNTQINTHLRILKMPTDYSFFSGHASSSVSRVEFRESTSFRAFASFSVSDAARTNRWSSVCLEAVESDSD